jgi:simple sugar transport system ATP-binding protein
MDQSIGRNIVATIIERLRNPLRLLDRKRVESMSEKGVRELQIKVPSIDAPVSTLSGGNQQRVVLAKWLATEPRILILDGPTIGIDVAAKKSIHEIIRGLSRRGIGIIIISDEVPEVMANCSRVLLMRRGELVGEYDPSRIEESVLLRLVNAG